jgi:hypothetical protein
MVLLLYCPFSIVNLLLTFELVLDSPFVGLLPVRHHDSTMCGLPFGLHIYVLKVAGSKQSKVVCLCLGICQGDSTYSLNCWRSLVGDWTDPGSCL